MLAKSFTATQGYRRARLMSGESNPEARKRKQEDAPTSRGANVAGPWHCNREPRRGYLSASMSRLLVCSFGGNVTARSPPMRLGNSHERIAGGTDRGCWRRTQRILG